MGAFDYPKTNSRNATKRTFTLCDLFCRNVPQVTLAPPILLTLRKPSAPDVAVMVMLPAVTQRRQHVLAAVEILPARDASVARKVTMAALVMAI